MVFRYDNHGMKNKCVALVNYYTDSMVDTWFHKLNLGGKLWN